MPQVTVRALQYTWDVMRGAAKPDIVACEKASLIRAYDDDDRLDKTMRRWCERCCVEGASRRYPGKAPSGCSDVGPSAKGRHNLRASCERHGLIGAGASAGAGAGAGALAALRSAPRAGKSAIPKTTGARGTGGHRAHVVYQPYEPARSGAQAR